MNPRARVASRLAAIPPTVFGEMSMLAAQAGAINLGQGFPDTDGPRAVLERAAQAVLNGENQYAPGPGRLDLRTAIAEHQARHYGIELDPHTQVVVTTGCTEAIAGALLGLVEPGDEVIVLEPMYDSYPAILAMAGATAVPVTLNAPEFRLSASALGAAITERTRFVLLNTPHNPTGRVFDADELAAVAALARTHDLIVITDEVYEHLTFDGLRHTPLATLPGMAERTLTLSSAGKSWSVTGWKVGWATGPAELVGAVLAAKQWLSYTSGAPLQPAIVTALVDASDFPHQLAVRLQHQRDQLCGALNDLGVPTNTPQGTYFAVSDVGSLGWSDGRTFARELIEPAGVACIPMQGFHSARPASQDAGRHLVRWAFCKQPSVLDLAVERLSHADLHA